jgi:hypothetical protein
VDALEMDERPHSQASRECGFVSDRWFAKFRMDWITEMLQIYGFINRHHLMRKFDISMPQASMDIRAYIKAHPDAMIYDLSQKQYVKKTK